MSLADLVKSDYMLGVKKDALRCIKEDRSRYDYVYGIIEEYVRKNKLIVSDRYVISKDILDKFDEKDRIGYELDYIFEKSYVIYSINPLKDANDLTNVIYEKCKDMQKTKPSDDKAIADLNITKDFDEEQAKAEMGEISEKNKIGESIGFKTDSEIFHLYKLTRMKTIKPYEEFTIEFNLRIIATVYKIQKYKSSNPIELMKPININSIYYMPSEIELIDTYHNLYIMKSYDKNIEYEKILFDQVRVRKELGVLGGIDCKVERKKLLESIKISLVADWLKTQKYVLIGVWAYDLIKLGKDLCANREKIQIIGDVHPDVILNDLTKYINEIAKASINYREQDLSIPKDFRTKRYTFYMTIKTESNVVDKPFLDYFNCSSYEVIPCYRNGNLLIGHEYVILRFLFIDLWIIRVIKNLNLISVDILNMKIDYLWKIILFMKEYFVGKEMSIEFIGTNVDYSISKKMSNLGGTQFFPYIPYMFEKTNKKLKSIGS